jgi:hypothetical protein
MMMALSRGASNPYTPTKGIVRARTSAMSATSKTAGSVVIAPTETPVMRKMIIPLRKAISPM